MIEDPEFRLAGVSLVDGRSLVCDIVRIQTSSSKFDGYTQVSSDIKPRFETSSVVSLVDGGF